MPNPAVTVQDAFLPAAWPAPLQVRALTTLRRPLGASAAPFDTFNLGTRCGDDAVAVARNRDTMTAILALPNSPVWLRQVHGTGVARVGDALHGPHGGIDEPEADAAVTSTPGVVLAILTADCLPVLFCSVNGDEVGAAHAGWRGLHAGVLEHTVASMRTPPDRLLAWLGPAAGPKAYEVGVEVRGAFVEADPLADSAFEPTRPGHWLCDLYALARQRLARAGVTRISGGQACTISDAQRFYSHRRDARTGRMASLIWIKQGADRA